ncbi:30S ribosomal protein S9 [Propioniciclava tarda]|uniref:Small ribosomal subunit protein uS9 n=1 Tax=Propioniciclava tarda TaxID=433330 RepID=A0A4Q9KHV8_PROTD|nr:30S ribosomal protein S9 [Propioniciclava tarda]TBT92187.1 30S ribosomal protein S9 [Propioniciclava tarda]SMO82140.1 SSU ribosomal protein S9P [Propioniciclava tarda]HOA88740.1 30S ribosomal protein S9 [Propioniciclava tarda]HQA30470.1 30S ribosomal protein S9 [Propioniciclava tarda]HQD60926.1 30S ribosomal protein S9 [Propioniciclava tarda]
MTETPDTTDLADDAVTSFVDEQDREIAYRSEAVPSSATPGARPAVVAPGAATGRRKEAIARVRLAPGSGKFSINGRSLEEYFPNKLHQQTINEPFETAAVVGSYDVIAKIIGGGVTGQAGALRLAIARALNAVDAEASRPALKKAGLLTRDARVKERKKAGLKKARKAPQYSKR